MMLRPLLSKTVSWAHNHLSERMFILVLALIVGILTALAAQLLKWIIEEIPHLLTAHFDSSKSQWLFLVYPLIGIFLSALFIKYIVRDNIGHGITKILYAISRNQGFIRLHNCWSSIVASGITIGFGGSVGAESPIVLTGSAIGSAIARHSRLIDHRKLMILVGCGASGAVAGIYKAPVAGLVFTLEVLMIDLTMGSLLPLLVSSLTATCVTYALTGTTAIYSYREIAPFDVERVPLILLLGVTCGLLSLYFTRAMNSFEQFFGRISNLYIKVALGGSILAVLIFFLPALYGEGYSTVSTLLNTENTENLTSVLNNSLFYGHDNLLLVYLTLVMIFKVFATTATNGGGGCGGTFAPSLFLGCIAGFVFANVWNIYQPFGIIAPVTNSCLLGMAGMMSGVFHAPLTAIFLIAELTGGYDLFLSLMIVSVGSYLTIHSFEPHSIYAMRLARSGQLLTHNKDSSVLTLMSLDAVIEKHRPTLVPSMRLSQMVQVISNDSGNNFAVLDKAGLLVGIINLQSLRHIIYRTELYGLYTVEQLMLHPEIILHTDDQMVNVMQTFESSPFPTLPVLDPEGNFVGFASKTRLYALYRKVLKDFSEE